jgi:hypothetical protein
MAKKHPHRALASTSGVVDYAIGKCARLAATGRARNRTNLPGEITDLARNVNASSGPNNEPIVQPETSET